MKKKTMLLLLIGSILIGTAALFTYYELKKTPDSTLKGSNNLFTNLQTNQARYHPGEKVVFTANEASPVTEITVSYYHLDQLIEKQSVQHVQTNHYLSWSWSPPDKDFKGYLAKVTMTGPDRNSQTETIAIDVSSDWTAFPRYGFLSEFGSLSKKQQKSTISQLNRYHLNGLQFYDWQFEHQQPLPLDGTIASRKWQDVANREISFHTIQTYIDLAHEKNMKTMSYNLLYGSFSDRNLPREWHLFKDRNQMEFDQHPLPKDWKSNIEIMNPTNPWWQDHIIAKQQEVYDRLPFDGWHIDQLGARGDVFNEHGEPISIARSFEPFLHKIKEKIPNKEVIVNGVNQYGQRSIADGEPSFLYTEVWDPNKYYGDLKRILDENASFSQNKKPSVLAAYMNYRRSEHPGLFNEPGILLANSVIFANGGAHLELGEHMLSKEYFPHHQLKMSKPLKKKLTSYYDFLTAYENVLRDKVQQSSASISSDHLPLTVQEPEQGKLWVVPKEKKNSKILHFINFSQANSMEWRDKDGRQTKPRNIQKASFTLVEDRPIKKIWMASPDIKQGQPASIPFEQKGSNTTFTLPSLTYWDMVVVEYKKG